MDPAKLIEDSTFDRRHWLRYAALLGSGAVASALGGGCGVVSTRASAAGGAAVARDGDEATTPPDGGADSAPRPLARSPKRYEMKKSINTWAFPYPSAMNLREVLELAARAGFDAVEINYSLDDDLSPTVTVERLNEIRRDAERTGVEISGLCSFLFWPFPFTSGSPATRARALELAKHMIEVAHHLGTDNLLVVPGAVYVPWLEDSEEVPWAVCDERARAAVRELIPVAEEHQVHLNIENIFFNGYLLSPRDMVEFVDSFDSPWVHVHFDTGNIMPFQFPEHWIPVLGERIRNIHFKEWTKKGTDFSLESFRPLLDGTTNWPAVLTALDDAGYRGYLTFEYFHPFPHYPEALIYQASDALDRMLGRA